jgi:uncharacterized protein (TIGR04141 family)
VSSTQTLSAYLLKKGITSPLAALKEEHRAGLREHAVAAGETVGTLYVSEGEESSPEWVKFLMGVTEPPVAYRTRSVSAVLLLEASSRWFALTFGFGRRLLDPEGYERDFGLLCAMNSVNPGKLRGAEARTFDEYALHTLRQLSRLSSISSLEINTDRELIVSMEGQLEDPDLGKRIDGRDAVRITADLGPAELRAKCSDLLRESKKKLYQNRFPFFDTIKRVRDPGEIARLERLVANALGQQRFSDFDLFPAQVVSEDIVAFEFSVGGRPTRVIEPHSGLLSKVIGGPQSPQKIRSKLERLYLQGLDGNGDVVAEWSFFRCLHWEHNDGASVFVLDGGQWYRIDPSLVADVETFAAAMTPSGINWPAATATLDEGKYNETAATQLDCALLDKTGLIRLPGQTPVEPCDLFTKQRQFIHVKRRKGGSSPLSHLFMQAVVSAEGFVKEGRFRSAFCDNLEKTKAGYGAYSPDKVSARDYEIVLALIAKPGARSVAEDLPFFSKVTLRLAVRQLQAMNFRVSIDTIPIQTVLPTGMPPQKGRAKRPGRQTPAPSSNRTVAKGA